MDPSPLTRFKRITAIKFATIYVIWSLCWVLGSDFLTHIILHGPTVEWRVQSFKGVTYVLVSGFILLLSIRERDLKHKAERAANESMVRSLRRSGLIGIYEWRTDGSIIDANSSFLEALGYSTEDLKAGKLMMRGLTPREYWERDNIAAQQVTDTGHCGLYEKQVICKDGRRLDVLVGRSLLNGYSDRGIGYAADITELKAAQAEKSKLADQLLQAEKLNALGKLAGGVAHDFNNLLSVVVGYASLAESRLPTGDPVRNHATQILCAADKAQKLVRKLMAFSRKQKLVPELINVNPLIMELHGILDRILDKRIEVVFRLDPALGHINADASQVEQVIMNLVLNARDAMLEGGILTIETMNVKLPQEPTRMELADDFVMIRVKDTGTGMSPEVRARIFEPFYTTKQESGGTGLGLATVYGIVNQSGGRIEVESAAGHGSTFTVYFPRAHGARLSAPESAQPSPEFGKETILLAEDRQDVREMLTLTLKSNGYNVIETGDGETAVNKAQTFAGDIHLMITDIIMPYLSGADAVRRIRQFRPDLKVIFITGYAEEPYTQPAVPFSVTLEKPLRPDVLLTRIRQLLDRASLVTDTTRSA
jgi:PAS domain S-box-containing protein